VTITCGSDVTGFDAVRVGRGMRRAPFPFCGCGGTPHGPGSFAERTVSGGRLSGRGKGVAKQTGVATRGPLFTLCTKKGGVGTWWRRNLSGTVSVTWRSVPGGCRRRARLVLTVFPVGPGRCWLFPFRSDLDAAGSSCSGRRKEGERKRDGRASLTAGRNGPGKKEEAGRPGFPRNGRERVRKKREKAGKPGFPRNGRERTRNKGRKRESRGSLAMGGNGPGREEKAGKPGFPRNGRERARKKGESGLSVRSEAESESVLDLG
jgi:hypothetical protein